jgi:large subunit ribosomal protein L5e
MFIKVVKTKAYFKRYQVKFKRRREGKTDFRARKKMVAQDKTKYNAPKNRLVVRFTNKDVVCQVVSAKLTGDYVLTAAYSHELPKYGLKVGLKNYSAAYCTGLLCARRLLQKYKLDSKYEGVKKVDGKYFLVEEIKDEARPFKAALDVGLARTTTGARVFGALKGACDGGLLVPHSQEGKRFPGYNDEESKYDPSVHRDKIFGKHVSDYMKHLKESDEKRYQTQFALYIKNGVDADGLKKVYENVHAAIRKDPKAADKKKAVEKPKSYSKQRLTLTQRKTAVKEKKERIVAEINKIREEKGLVVEEEEGGAVKIRKKDKVKQLSTKKPKAPKSAAAATDDAKGGKKKGKK